MQFMQACRNELVEERGIERERIVFFLDNCPCHSSFYARYNLLNQGIKVIFNTACTPAFNIIECVFADLKFSIRK